MLSLREPGPSEAFAIQLYAAITLVAVGSAAKHVIHVQGPLRVVPLLHAQTEPDVHPDDTQNGYNSPGHRRVEPSSRTKIAGRGVARESSAG